MCNSVIRGVIVCIIIGTLYGCSRQSSISKPKFDKRQFVQLYAGTLLIQKSSLPANECEQKLQVLFSRYGLTPQKYQQIRYYYEQHPQEWEKLLTEVIEQLKKQRQAILQKEQAR